MNSSVSVIIPSHNARDFVAQTLESILAQTHPVEQVIVIDDSTDDTPRVVEPFVETSGGRVELYVVPPCNVSQARNAAFEHVRGDLVAFLDADDIWLPEKTRLQVEALEANPSACGAFCHVFTFRKDLDDMGRVNWDKVNADASVEHIVKHQFVAASMTLIRRSMLGGIRFDERTGHAEDTVFSAELALRGPWVLVDQPLLARRLHGTQATANPWHHVKNIETRVTWCRERRALIGHDLSDRLEDWLWDRLVEHVERLYWARQFEHFEAMRARAMELCPQKMRRSTVAGKKILPRWMYRVRDLLPGE